MSTNQRLELPQNSRGTLRVKGFNEDLNLSEMQVLTLIQEKIQYISFTKNVTILMDVTLSGNGWLILWWPASEPKHDAMTKIITPENHKLTTDTPEE